MTEEGWLACENPEQMLLFIKQRRAMRKQTKQRKQKLFAVACCRRIWSSFRDEQSRRCIEVVERSADNRATGEELEEAATRANAIWLKDAADDASFACNQLFWKEVDGLHVSSSTLSAVFQRQRAEANK